MKKKKSQNLVIIGLIQSWNTLAEIIFCHFIYFIFAIVIK